jgi:uncharacterized protein (TIGR02453 family)
MSAGEGFTGFPRATLSFYRGLKRSNDKLWFERHRGAYEEQVLAPARAFVEALGRRLRRIAPRVHADPRVDRSIFRIHRDTRFSPDKRPFKTHLGLWFWEGDGPRMECSGYYVHVEPPRFMLGVGLYIFPRHLLQEYRASLIDARHGASFTRMLRQIERHGCYRFGGEHYRRVPRGYDPDHRHASYLRFNGLYAGIEGAIPPDFHTAAWVDHCERHFRAMHPVHRWLLPLTRRAQAADGHEHR